MIHPLTCLCHAEALPIFLRWIYAADIAKLDQAGRIYRDNSVAMVGSGVLLRAHDESMLDELIGAYRRHSSLKPHELLLKWIPILKQMSQFNRIIYRNAFVAARRRYPKGLTTLEALSGMLMLRHIMAEVKPEHVPISLMQQIMNIAVFKPNMNGSNCDISVLMEMADFILGLPVLSRNSVPKDGLEFETFVDLICGAVPGILQRINVTRTVKDHPVVFSIQELIETCFVGADEDPRDQLKIAGEAAFP
jgi:hypothetical protein